MATTSSATTTPTSAAGKPLPFGQVYATLARLARDGKVEAGDPEPGAGPERKRYVITEQGVTEVEAWLAEPVEPEPHLQTVLFAKVVLALMTGRSGRGLPRHPAGRAPAADAGADRAPAHRRAWSTRCWPITGCSIWRPTCAGST